MEEIEIRMSQSINLEQKSEPRYSKSVGDRADMEMIDADGDEKNVEILSENEDQMINDQINEIQHQLRQAFKDHNNPVIGAPPQNNEWSELGQTAVAKFAKQYLNALKQPWDKSESLLSHVKAFEQKGLHLMHIEAEKIVNSVMTDYTKILEDQEKNKQRGRHLHAIKEAAFYEAMQSNEQVARYINQNDLQAKRQALIIKGEQQLFRKKKNANENIKNGGCITKEAFAYNTLAKIKIQKESKKRQEGKIDEKANK
ncbi:hypothetical protein FGO68_gene12240 [Halteria grandinella]|uniref:Uncharacterized protein n=1 Tax=Halteria grandinella TaxID=5974 RepID=A0A8J8NS80_HALGN|nr:hypothetical protein FGO68_gene12240 [Halteria grandinella]